MKYRLTHNENSDRLILIFAGWSTDPDFYSHISVGGYDVMVVYDYSDFDFNAEVLDRYQTVCLFAWSMGVFAASVTVPYEKACIRIAVNGTEFPVDDEMGIPATIFHGTGERLDERNLLKFQKRMAGSSFTIIRDRFPQPDIELLKRELESIHQATLSSEHSSSNSNSGYPWQKVYIGEGDAIFPPANQLKAWQSNPHKPQIVSVDMPHYIDLSRIVNATVPHIEEISRKFHKALPTYSSNASAQQNIVDTLVEMIPNASYNEALEIGPGSGDLSRAFTSRFHPEKMTYVDLYKLPIFGLADTEIYHHADAEDWMQKESVTHPDTYDIVLSSSTMQWFVDPVRFISNASKVLKNGGILACSTFLPGNLKELSAINPFGMLYRRAETFTEVLKANFSYVESEEKEITIHFDNAREALIHLSLTGASGSAKSGIPVADILRRIGTTLTYRAFIFVAKK